MASATAHEITNKTSADLIVALGREVEDKQVVHRFLDETGKLQLVEGSVKATRFDAKLTIPASPPAKRGGIYSGQRSEQAEEPGQVLLNAADYATISETSAFKALLDGQFISVRPVKVDAAPAARFEVE